MGMDARTGMFTERLGHLPYYILGIGMRDHGNSADLRGEIMPSAEEHKSMICGHCGDPGHCHFFCKLPHTYGSGRDYSLLSIKPTNHMKYIRKCTKRVRTANIAQHFTHHTSTLPEFLNEPGEAVSLRSRQ
jgi:REP element-mobilizing transposase RayT